jgi:hypothetical protein
MEVNHLMLFSHFFYFYVYLFIYLFIGIQMSVEALKLQRQRNVTNQRKNAIRRKSIIKQAVGPLISPVDVSLPLGEGETRAVPSVVSSTSPRGGGGKEVNEKEREKENLAENVDDGIKKIIDEDVEEISMDPMAVLKMQKEYNRGVRRKSVIPLKNKGQSLIQPQSNLATDSIVDDDDSSGIPDPNFSRPTGEKTNTTISSSSTDTTLKRHKLTHRTARKDSAPSPPESPHLQSESPVQVPVNFNLTPTEFVLSLKAAKASANVPSSVMSSSTITSCVTTIPHSSTSPPLLSQSSSGNNLNQAKSKANTTSPSSHASVAESKIASVKSQSGSGSLKKTNSKSKVHSPKKT